MKNNSEIAERERQMIPVLESEEASNSLAALSESDKELLWKQYALHVDLYKHYLDLVLKFNIFYYASTGAILSFYFSKTDVSLIKFSLLFPIMASVCFGILFLYGANALRVTRQEMFDIRDKLDLDTAPEFNLREFPDSLLRGFLIHPERVQLLGLRKFVVLPLWAKIFGRIPRQLAAG